MSQLRAEDNEVKGKLPNPVSSQKLTLGNQSLSHKPGEEDATLGKRQPPTNHVGSNGIQENGKENKLIKTVDQRNDCPHLYTIKRHLLDFDFQASCSVTMVKDHVYCCLVCGKNYKGRGKDTLAYVHSLEEGHYMFISLTDAKVYCLPENYEVTNKSLNDIKVGSVDLVQPQAYFFQRRPFANRGEACIWEKS